MLTRCNQLLIGFNQFYTGVFITIPVLYIYTISIRLLFQSRLFTIITQRTDNIYNSDAPNPVFTTHMIPQDLRDIIMLKTHR